MESRLCSSSILDFWNLGKSTLILVQAVELCLVILFSARGVSILDTVDFAPGSALLLRRELLDHSTKSWRSRNEC